MVDQAAPTPAFIQATQASLDVFCPTCRVLRMANDLPAKLIASGRGDTPVDRVTFRCEKCGALGQPWVITEGNINTRRRLWPPEDKP